MTLSRFNTFSLLLPLLSCCLGTGCANFITLPAIKSDDGNAEVKLKESPEAAMFRARQTARESNAIILQIEDAEKPIRILPLPEDGKTVFMNDLIRQTGLKSRFNSLDVTLFRSSGHVMDEVKMAVAFNRKSGRVTAGTDYALRPGDRITIRKVLNTTVQSVLDGLIPPMAQGR